MKIWTLIIYILLTYTVTCAAITCYKCQSTELESCAVSLTASDLPFEDCPVMSMQCIVSVVDSVTYRGCSGSTPVSGATFYKYCGMNLCNGGVYPPGRLKCHQCSDATCGNKQTDKAHPCRWYQQEDECYTEVVNAQQIRRGCRSDTNNTISTNSKFCNYNSCNNAQAAQTITCAECDSSKERDCKLDLTQINEPNCQITQYETCEINTLITESNNHFCFLHHKLDRVVRGCSNKVPTDLQLDSQYLSTCNNSDLCNAQCLSQQKCLICDSTLRLECRSNVTAISVTTCGSAQVSSCYITESLNGDIRRDCGSPASDLNIKRSYECDGAACNNINFMRCYQCSSATSKVCDAWSTPGFGVNIEECDNINAACVTAIQPNGIVLRSCESNSLFCNSTLVECQRCESSFCNKGLLHERIRCFQCANTAECTKAFASAATPCADTLEHTVIARDACLSYDDPKLGLVRGCRTNSNLYYECMLHNNGIGCQLCYEDGCNT